MITWDRLSAGTTDIEDTFQSFMWHAFRVKM